MKFNCFFLVPFLEDFPAYLVGGGWLLTFSFASSNDIPPLFSAMSWTSSTSPECLTCSTSQKLDGCSWPASWSCWPSAMPTATCREGSTRSTDSCRTRRQQPAARLHAGTKMRKRKNLWMTGTATTITAVVTTRARKDPQIGEVSVEATTILQLKAAADSHLPAAGPVPTTSTTTATTTLARPPRTVLRRDGRSSQHARKEPTRRRKHCPKKSTTFLGTPNAPSAAVLPPEPRGRRFHLRRVVVLASTIV